MSLEKICSSNIFVGTKFERIVSILRIVATVVWDFINPSSYASSKFLLRSYDSGMPVTFGSDPNRIVFIGQRQIMWMFSHIPVESKNFNRSRARAESSIETNDLLRIS